MDGRSSGAARRAARICGWLLVAVAITAGPAPGSELEGDRAFARRNRGFIASGTPSPEPTEAAIRAYESVLDLEPSNLRVLFKLMDALYFKGYHLARGEPLEREIYERLVELSTRALDLVREGAGGVDPDGLSPEELADRLRGVPEAAAAHLWAATAWGLWGTTHSKLAALRHGVAGKVRSHSRVVIALDETYGEAGGLRYLGRLYTAAPRVPFITGWADRQEGLAMLERAVRISRRDPRNPLFLAEALLEHAPERRGEALRLLCDLVRRQPDPEHLVEQSESLRQARDLLDRLDASSCAEA